MRLLMPRLRITPFLRNSRLIKRRMAVLLLVSGSSLPEALDGVRIGNAVCCRCDERHDENGEGARRYENRSGRIAHRACIHGNRGNGNDEGQGGGAVQGNRSVRPASQFGYFRVFVVVHRQEDGDGADEHEHRYEPDKQKRVFRHGKQIDFRAGNDEEQGSEIRIRWR